MKRCAILSILVLSTLICIAGPCRADDTYPSSGSGNEANATRNTAPDTVVTLAQGLKEVMTNSHQVRITQEGEQISSADVRIARSGFFPTVNGSASHTSLLYPLNAITDVAVPIVSSPVVAPSIITGAPVPGALITGQGTERIIVPEAPADFWSFSATVQETLFDFWRTIGLYKASKEQLNNSKLDTARVRNLSALEFATAYFNLLRGGEGGDRCTAGGRPPRIPPA